MPFPRCIFYSIAVAVFATGTLEMLAAGFVKNADVGGYKVVVEGGGVEERKEIQYDANGKVIYDSENSGLKKLFGNGKNIGNDASLFGGNGGLQLENLTAKPTTPTNAIATGTHTVPAKMPNLKDENLSVPADAQQELQNAEQNSKSPRKRRSPWARPLVRKLPPEMQKTNGNTGETEKNLKDKEEQPDRPDSIFIDPKAAMLNQPTTEDGRKLPFYIGEKIGDGKDQIDATGTLKNFMQLNDTFAGTRDVGEAKKIETTDRYENIITMEQWHSKYSSLGTRKAENYEEESAFSGAKYSGVKMLERNIIENNLTWSRSKASQITIDNSLAQKIIEKYATGNTSKHGAMRLASPGESNGISMQDINRYQFRRSHSDQAGLPVVSPGGKDVEIKK